MTARAADGPLRLRHPRGAHGAPCVAGVVVVLCSSFWGCSLCLLFVFPGCRVCSLAGLLPLSVSVARLGRLLLGCFCGCGPLGCGGGPFGVVGRLRFRRRFRRLRLRCRVVACGRCFRRPPLLVVCSAALFVSLLCRLVFVARFGLRGCRCGRGGVFAGEVAFAAGALAPVAFVFMGVFGLVIRIVTNCDEQAAQEQANELIAEMTADGYKVKSIQYKPVSAIIGNALNDNRYATYEINNYTACRHNILLVFDK